jgi:FkbM family methyltransferase
VKLYSQDRAVAVRSAIAEQLVSPWAVRALEPFTRRRVRHLGTTIQTDNMPFSPYTRAELFWGLYERTECTFIRQYLQGSKRVVELGSGLGVSSAHIASALAPGSQLVCVEANPDFLPAIERNVARHTKRLSIRSTLLNAAIGREGETCALSTDPNPYARTTSAAEPYSAASALIPARSLTALLNQIGFGSYDLVCDIEGAEVNFIVGDDCHALQQCRTLVAELHDCNLGGTEYTPDDLLQALNKRWGFAVQARKGAVVALRRPERDLMPEAK